MATAENKIWFPRTSGKERPSALWYYGRAIFVSRRDYRRIFFWFFATGVTFGITALATGMRLFWNLSFFVAFLGLAMLLFSLTGLYLQYARPARRYFRKLLAMEKIPANAVVADIHIGTYRHSYMLSELLPAAKVYSVDCKREPRFSEELAVREVQALEETPESENIVTVFTKDFRIPLENGSCDVAVFGFGTHEIPDQERNRIFDEAKRILKPGGKVFLFEHGIDALNYLIFGPVIFHVTRRKTWEQVLSAKFTGLRQSRLFAVNLFSATNN
jgi:SAM-dependent methyltransferase